MLVAGCIIEFISTSDSTAMAIAELELKLHEIDEAIAGLQHQLEALENIVQEAPSAHRPGPVSPEVLRAERDVRDLVLAIVELDRRRLEVTVEMGLRR